jgi:hypothetical protein
VPYDLCNRSFLEELDFTPQEGLEALEVTDDVFESEHSTKAVLVATLAG